MKRRKKKEKEKPLNPCSLLYQVTLKLKASKNKHMPYYLSSTVFIEPLYCTLTMPTY